jgi:hypothetical protein
MKNKRNKSLAKTILLSILSMVVLLLLVAGFIWKNEIRTLLSIKEIMPGDDDTNGYVYEMTVYGDYYLDEYLQAGGTKSDKELISFLTSKITKGLFNLSIEESDIIGCSSFSANAANGDKVFARNYDMYKTNVAIVHTMPRNRYKSISTVDLSFLGVASDKSLEGLGNKINTIAAAYAPLDGMNEKGLTVGIYMTHQGPGKINVPTDQDTGKPDITSTVLLRLMLDQAATVEEAVAIAEKYDMHDSANSSFHYMISDANGRSAVLEYIAGTDSTDTDGQKRGLMVIYNDDPTSLADTDKFQLVTNFIVYPGYYEEGDKQHGLDRYQIVKEELEIRDGLVKDDEDAMSVLEKAALRDWNNDIYSVTIHSVVYNQTNKTVYWVGNRHYGEEAYIYRFKLME